MNNAAVHIHVQVFVGRYAFCSLRYMTDNELLIDALIFEKLSTFLFKQLQRFTFLPAIYYCSNFSTSSQHLLFSTKNNYSYRSRWEVVCHCSSDLCFSKTNDAEYLFMYLLAICTSSLPNIFYFPFTLNISRNACSNIRKFTTLFIMLFMSLYTRLFAYFKIMKEFFYMCHLFIFFTFHV